MKTISTSKTGYVVENDDAGFAGLLQCTNDSLIVATLNGTKEYSILKKSFCRKLRLTYLDAEKEEMLAFLPTANWKINSYTHALLLNDDFVNETSSFVILHTLGCGICSIAMPNATIIPAVLYKV